MKRALWLLLCGTVISSLMLTACVPTPAAPTEAPVATEPAPAEEATEPAPVEEKPIKIGVSLPLTGVFSISGEKHKDGYELWAKLVNDAGGLLGRPVELIVSDNKSDVETAVSQTERFIHVDKVDILFGTFSSKLIFPVSAISERAKMVYSIPSGVALRIYERGFNYIFNLQQTAGEYVGSSVITMIKELVDPKDLPKTAAVVYADEFFAKAVVAGLLGEKVEIPGTDKVIDLAPGFLAEAGIEVALVEQWPEGFTDWFMLANSIKASGAEFLFGFTASPDEAIELTRVLQAVDYQPKGINLGQGTQEEFREALGDAANSIMIHAAWHPAVQWESLLAGKKFANQDFVEAFQKEYGRVPDEDEAIPFAVGQTMEQAIRATGTTNNTVLRDWLAARTKEDPIKTVIGERYWDERGLPIDKAFLVTQWQDGELKFVYPVGEFPGTSDLIWPKPEW